MAAVFFTVGDGLEKGFDEKLESWRGLKTAHGRVVRAIFCPVKGSAGSPTDAMVEGVSGARTGSRSARSHACLP